MRSRGFLWLTLISTAFILQGCSSGYNRVSLSTVTNLGFDLETAPAKVETAVSSYEGLMMPTFEGGQTVPAISGVSTRAGKVGKFLTGRSSTLATGDAAYNMGYLYADCNQSVSSIRDIPDVELTKKPGLVPGPGEVKPTVFTTNSMLGVKLSLSRQAALKFSSAKAGFNRKEELSTPILVEPSAKDPAKFVAGTPSFIGTIDYAKDLTGRGGEGAPYKFIQYFASGEAANSLSLRSDVRQALFKRVTPDMQDSFCQDDYETKVR